MNLITFSRALPLVVLAAFIARPSLANPDDDSPSFTQQGPPPGSNDRYVIEYDDEDTKGAINSQADKVFHNLGPQKAVAVQITNPKTLVALANRPGVKSIEADPVRYALGGVRGNNSLEAFAENLLKSTTTPRRELRTDTTMGDNIPYGIGLVQADLLDPGAGEIMVCIIDSGIDADHEDLAGNAMSGYPDATNSWDFDNCGHGTHVAGSIAALDNGGGVEGVIADGSVELFIVKVFGSTSTGCGWSYGSTLVDALNRCEAAADSVNKKLVINMSLGGGGSSTTESNAFAGAAGRGVLTIAAAGNGDSSSSFYPASYDSIISVAAVDANKDRAYFSQYNSQVEIAAPGLSVYSTIDNSGYGYKSGTSMASPHVAGVAALVWSNHAACSNDKIREALGTTAEDLGAAGRDVFFGYGLVQAKAASDWLGTDCGASAPTTTTPPPPACISLGNSCTSDGDCCFNKCRGRNGGKTCK